MQNKPYWWDRYFSPWSEEHNKFYEDHKKEITFQHKEMDWDKGIRFVIYKDATGKINKKFTENF